MSRSAYGRNPTNLSFSSMVLRADLASEVVVEKVEGIGEVVVGVDVPRDVASNGMDMSLERSQTPNQRPDLLHLRPDLSQHPNSESVEVGGG